MRIFTFGAPGHLGGASTELWHTIKLWRRFSAEVSVIPTWALGHDIEERLAKIGVPVHRVSEDTLDQVSGLSEGIVVSFCNAEFLKHYAKLKAIGCRLVWANCMTWAFQGELSGFREHGPPDALLFQSEWQKTELVAKWKANGLTLDRGHLIHGAFDLDGWDYAPRPHPKDSDFVLGKLARDDCDKWSSNLWPIYGRVQYKHRKALVMGMTPRIAKKLGELPDWANFLRPCAMEPQDYYRKIHCLLTVNGGAAENWPRIGLECFAAGVPVVAQREWGWREQIEEGRTGFLGSTDEELAHWAAVLAYDEPLRLRICANARERLVSELAHPETLWRQWQQLFASVTQEAVAA